MTRTPDFGGHFVIFDESISLFAINIFDAHSSFCRSFRCSGKATKLYTTRDGNVWPISVADPRFLKRGYELCWRRHQSLTTR